MNFLENDISFKSWLNKKERPPKIIWINGMNSSGSKPVRLAAMGYDVKSVGTTNNYFAAYLGRFSRYSPFSLLKGQIGSMGSKHIDDNVRKQQEETKDFVPDVVVGTSQGGAVAMKLGNKYPNAKFVLGCPAWKIFNSEPINLPKDTIIVHGLEDITVPIEDSIELARKNGFKLRKYRNISHGLPLQILKLAIDDQLRKLGISIPKQPPNAQQAAP